MPKLVKAKKSFAASGSKKLEQERVPAVSHKTAIYAVLLRNKGRIGLDIAGTVVSGGVLALLDCNAFDIKARAGK